MNIGPSTVVAPTPQLTLAEQHSLAARGKGHLPGGGVQPVGPPPSMAAAGNASAGGRLIALGIHPVAPTGPVAVPGGNRRGAFAANPRGKPGASGTPDLAGSKLEGKGSGTRTNGALPPGLHVGAANSGATSPVERNGGVSSNGNSNGNGADGAREMASLSSSRGTPGARTATPVSDDKITDVDRKVFGGKRVYGRTLNMPNLNSSTGSWVIKFAELDGGRKEGELLEPFATEKSDPGYPLELIRANVHGTVTLYAVIHADGKVGNIRVLNSPDERLDSYAAQALARWKFLPAERAGKPGASGTPDLAGGGKGDSGSKTRNNGHGSLPAGLHVGAADSGATSPVERNGAARGNSSGNGADGAREMASLSSAGATAGARSGARAVSAVPDDKVTDVDRQVFGGKRFYEMALNMPNLNSSTGSWVIRFAELDAGRKEGELLAPVATEKSDPGYPLELIRANVHGMVTLYAVIHADGKVGDIRVLNSPDERLDSFAAKALARWKFVPAVRAGKPVALEAVVVIPFRVRRNF